MHAIEMGARCRAGNHLLQTRFPTGIAATQVHLRLRGRNKIAGCATPSPHEVMGRGGLAQFTRVHVVVRQTTRATHPERSSVFLALTVTVPE